MESAKELWEALENKYISEDASSKSFIVSQFNNYKMVEEHSVLDQLYEIQRILSHFKQHNMHMDETIVVSSTVDKLSPSWKDTKRTLKHKKEDMTLEDLANHLRIEEELHLQDESKEHVSKIHVIEDGESSQGPKGNKKRPYKDNNNKGNKKEKVICWECNKPDHKKRDCNIWKCKHGLNNQKVKTKDNFVAMINDQINIVQSDNDWRVDSSASKHICKDRSLFKTLVPVEDGEVLYIGNSSTVDVKGIGQVE